MFGLSWPFRSRPAAVAAPTRTLICVGDSITRGAVSADYVAILRRRHAREGLSVVNLGHDGNLAWNVLERLDDAIDHRPSPDVVTVLIGTNDVNATHDETWQQYYRRGQHLPQRADLDFYRDSLDTILRRLRTETTARVAVLDLPPLGEDLDAPANRMVDVYRGVLREVAAAHDVPVLPLHERLVALFPPGHTPPPFHMSLTGIGIATAERLVLRRSWDDVSRRAGLAVLTDHVHLNDRAAGVVADLIGEFLAEQG